MQLSGYNVVLRDISQSDLEQLRDWRNDPDIARQMISQDEITAEQQQAWFMKIQRDPGQQHWMIEYKGEPIGSANIKALYARDLADASSIEPGLYIGEARFRGNLIAFAPTLLLNDYCFEVLGAKQLRAVVKRSNQAALKYNEKLGYKLQKDAELCELTLTASDYQQATGMLKNLLSR